MKQNPLFSTLLTFLALGLGAQATDISKASNNTALNLAGSWVSGGPPGSSDVGVWDAPYNTSPSLASVLGDNMTWSGIRVASPTTVPRIRASAGKVLTLGAGGIDMSAATNNFDMYAALKAGADQSWNINTGRTLTLQGDLQGSGVTITKSGAGILALASTAMNYPGALTINAGTVQATNTSGIQELSGSLGGTGALSKSGAGTLTLSGDNSAFSGGVTLTSGQLNLNHASALGSGVFIVSGGSIDNTRGTPLTLDGAAPLAWNGDFSFLGTSTLDLGSTATSIAGSRSVTVSGGTLAISSTVTGGTSAALTKLGAGTLETKSGSSIDLEGKIAVGGGTLRITAGSVACGSVSGNLELTGGGTIELNGGTLTARSIVRTGATANFRFNGGTLKPRADSSTFMTGLDSATVGSAGAHLSLDGWFTTIGQPLLHDPALGATLDGGLLVDDLLGGGYLTLTGASTYTGPTTVQSGTLSLGSGGSIAASSLIDLQAAATLELLTAATLASGQTLQGTGTLTGTLTVAAGGNISPAGSTIGILTATGTLNLAGTATFQIDKTGVPTADMISGMNQVTYGGALTVTATGSALTSGDTFKLFDATAYAGAFTTFNLPALSAGLFWETSGLTVDGTIKVINTLPTPIFSPLPGHYVSAQSVTITSGSGSTIHYTTDGSNPMTSGTAIAGASPLGVVVPVNSLAYTIKAYATKAGITDSSVATAVYNTVGTSIWTLNGAGIWSDSVNWQNALIADGSGFTADFSTLTLTGDATATLDGPRTIGNLKFGDVGNTHNWLIDNFSGEVLTLDAAANTPVVTVVNQTATITAPLAGSHGMTKNGAGTLVLAGINNLTGDTAISAGTLQLGTGSTNGNFGSGNDPIAGGAKLLLNYGTAVPTSSGAWSNKISGAGTLELKSAQGANGGANWGPNSAAAMPFAAEFTGTLQLDNGRIDSSPAGLGGISNIIINNGAQFLAWTGTYTQPITIAGNGWGESGYPGGLRSAGDISATWNGSVTLSADSGINSQRNGTFTIGGTVTGPYQLEFVTQTGQTGTILMAPLAAVQNSYGSSKVTTGAIVVAGNSYAFSNGALTMNGGTLSLNGFNFSFANLAGATGTIRDNAATGSVLTVGSDNSSTSYDGTLVNGSTGALGLTKTGTGTLILSNAANNYTGNTAVNAGSLVVNGSLSGTPAVTVAAAGTLGGNGTVAGTLTAAGTIAPGSASAGTLSTGSTTLTGTYACQLDGANSDKLAVTGNLTLTGSTLAVSTITAPVAGTAFVLATYTGTLTGTFATVVGVPSGYGVSYATANQIKLVETTGFTSWVAGFGLTGNNALAAADPDHDGISNGTEYVVGGNPAAVMDASLLPTLTLVTANVGNGSQNYLKFTYRRTKASADALVTAACEYNTGLTGTWTTATTGVAGVVVQTTPSGFSASPQVDRVEVYVPQSLSAAGKLFGRLHTTIP